MNKTNLQKELKEKVKPGIKPSDLKKQREKNINLNEDEGYESDNPIEEIKNQIKSKGNNKKAQELFTCSTCQKKLPHKLTRLIDKEGKKTCRDCLNNMLNLANQETGEEVILRRKTNQKEEETITP